MKKNSSQAAAGAIIAFLIILCGAYAVFAYQKDNATRMPKIAQQAIMSASDSKKLRDELFGMALSEDKQAFENIIRQLLLISPDDKAGGFASRQDIDMKAREKHFSAQSYPAYAAYVDQQKKDILLLGVDSGAPYTCRGIFKHGSQKYTEDAQGSVVFSAEGQFLCGAWDASASNGRYEIKVKTKSDVTNPANILIDVWEINILEPVRRKSSKKDNVSEH